MPCPLLDKEYRRFTNLSFAHGVITAEEIAEGHFASGDFWVFSKWRYSFPVFLGHPRWQSPKMVSVEPSLPTVKVKCPNARDSTDDQKFLPWVVLLRQVPRLCPAIPPVA